MASKSATEPTAMETQLSMQGAPGWTPNPGDTIVGIVTGIQASNPNEYGVYPILTLVTEPNGDMVNIHAFHDVLRNRLLEKRPAPGEKVAIQYMGEREPKNPRKPGQTYHAYAVVVDRPDADAATDWDTFGKPEVDSTEGES